MSMRSKIKSFFGASRQYVVAGASNNPSKFGYKVSKWYVSHGLPLIPINPREEEILGVKVVPSVDEVLEALSSKQEVRGHGLKDRDGISISFLTPPAATRGILQSIASHKGYKDLIKGLWFQPGSYDQSVIDEAQAIGVFDKVVYEDECILVRGEEGLYNANL